MDWPRKVEQLVVYHSNGSNPKRDASLQMVVWIGGLAVKEMSHSPSARNRANPNPNPNPPTFSRVA